MLMIPLLLETDLFRFSLQNRSSERRWSEKIPLLQAILLPLDKKRPCQRQASYDDVFVSCPRHVSLTAY